MGFHEVQFDTNISYGSVFGPGHETTILELDSGAEERIVRRQGARRVYDVGMGVRTMAQLYSTYEFILARQGSAYGFRLKDWLDFATTADGRTATSGGGTAAVAFDDQVLGTGDGTTTQFQLVKKYTSGPATITRLIQKPVDATTVVGINGVEQTTGFTTDTTTGLVLFTTAPPNGQQVTGGCQFDVPVRLAKDADTHTAISIEAFDTGSLSIPLIELIDERAIPEDRNYGGSVTQNLTADIVITPAIAMYWRLDPTVDGKNVFLPPIEGFGTGGGPIFLIEHTGAGNTFTVRDDTGAQVALMSTTTNALWVMLASSGALRFWQVLA
jgi:uncharacterized protein (TIGR02217 family)